jgi:enoyl-CoA hydratase/carnithine racemase
MPYWKIDKYVRSLVGPNPFRAHDVIGAKGANFLTWSCLHHLAEVYGELFRPTPDLVEHKESGTPWYPPSHFRPVVDWSLGGDELEDLKNRILGPLFQMTSLVVQEKRAALPHANAIGELCAQFRSGALALVRRAGPEEARARVAAYHKAHPAAARKGWHPAAFDEIASAEWQQLYVNAEHDGKVGVITFGRESYNWDVDAELNRAIDWLKAEGVDRVIVSGDFHLTTQLVGADTSEFHAALEKEDEGLRVSTAWSETARRLGSEFRVSVGFVGGKRCLGGMLELLMHCRYLVAVEGAELGMPEVTLPVVPGMEGCHWPFRKAPKDEWPKIVRLLLTGRPVKARDAVGWLVDSAEPLEGALKRAWQIANEGARAVPERRLDDTPMREIAIDGAAPERRVDDPLVEACRAIRESILESCRVTLAEALVLQARHSARFMTGKACREGRIGTDYAKTVLL